MSIIDKIKASVEAVIGQDRFYYNDGDGLNIDLDNANYPCAYAQLIEMGTLVDSFGMYHERVAIGIFFADIADVDLKPIPNEQILTRLKKSALVWLATMQNNDQLKLVEVRGTDRVYIQSANFDVRLTAYVVNVTLEEIEGFGVCDIDDCQYGCSSSDSAESDASEG